MPRSPYIPNPADQAMVHELAAIGLSEDDIAAKLGLPLRKLQKRFLHELKHGAAAGREQALRELHGVAMSGKNLNALLFWVKSRCGWRDTGPTQSGITVVRQVAMFTRGAKTPNHDQPR